MARKIDSRSMLSAEGGAVPAPVKHRRTARPQPVAPQHTEPAAEPVSNTQTQVSFEPISDHDEIARLAYSYWEARGYQGGSPEEDWARAEQEYRSRRQS